MRLECKSSPGSQLAKTSASDSEAISQYKPAGWPGIERLTSLALPTVSGGPATLRWSVGRQPEASQACDLKHLLSYA